MEDLDQATFLIGAPLAERIIEIARGANARIAAAFWSEDGVATLFGSSRRKPLIVCDISMGSTSPAALIALGAPKRGNLRHAERMHAKVFLSDRGLVLGSANVSLGALGRDGLGGWQVEAGTFHPAESKAWYEARTWFDDLHKVAVPIGDAELERARLTYRSPPPDENPPPPRRGSLMDVVTAAPDHFSGVSFVITRTVCEDDDLDEARKSAKTLGTGIEDATIDAWPPTGVYVKWDRSSTLRWQRPFISIWVGPRAIKYDGYRADIIDVANGSVLSRADWTSVKRAITIDLPDRRAAAALDLQTVRNLLGDEEGAFFANGLELAEALAELSK